MYADADRCLSILENELAKNNQQFIGGEKYEIIKEHFFNHRFFFI